MAEGLPSALGADDLAEVERLAHAVTGTWSANLGLMELENARCEPTRSGPPVRSKLFGLGTAPDGAALNRLGLDHSAADLLLSYRSRRYRVALI